MAGHLVYNDAKVGNVAVIGAGVYQMRLDEWNWSLPAIAMVVGVAIGLILVFTRSLWKALPGWFKWLMLLALIAFFTLLALGKMPLP